MNDEPREHRVDTFWWRAEKGNDSETEALRAEVERLTADLDRVTRGTYSLELARLSKRCADAERDLAAEGGGHVTGTITVPDWILISATRYALGRLSYVVSDTTQEIQRVWLDLEPNTKQVIARDIRQHLTDGAFVKSIDAPWRDLLAWIETQS